MASDTSKSNPSCLLHGPLDARFQNRPLPALDDPHDVIVRIAYTGVCGSDVHFWLHGGIRWPIDPSHPLTMGHEACGTIHAVGSAVTTLSPGDPVAIEPGYPCRRCPPCKSGRYNLCPDMRFAASPAPPPTHGTLCRFFKLPADFCYKVPSSVNLRDAVLVEPLAVGIHAVRLADVRPGQRVVVFGAGAVGLFCAAVSREFGAQTVVVVDVNQRRLEFAGNYVRGKTYLPDLSKPPEDNAMALLQNDELGLSGGADAVIDASGAEASMQTALFALRMGGTYVQAGMGKRKVEFPIAEMCEREITARGCWRYGAGDFELGMQLVGSGKVRLDGLVTSVFPFEKAAEAWEEARRGEGIKVVIEGVREGEKYG